jgi:hypothetical protein
LKKVDNRLFLSRPNSPINKMLDKERYSNKALILNAIQAPMVPYNFIKNKETRM